MIEKLLKSSLIILFLSLSVFKTSDLIPQIKFTYQKVRSEPENNSYFSDEMKYLKNFYLMKKGLGYYQAHLQASNNLAFQNATWNIDFWGWRLPTVFHFWAAFCKNGAGIFYLFIIMTIVTLICAYLITKKFVNSSIAWLSPLILIPYYLNALRSTSFLFITWWASFFFIIGLMFFFYKQKFLAMLLFTFAVSSREFYLISLTIMLILSYLYKKGVYQFLIPVLVFILLISFHAYQVSSLIHLSDPLGINQRTSAGFSKKLLLATLSFSTNSYLLVNFRPALIWLIFSLLGLCFLIVKYRARYKPLIALSSFLPMFLCIPFMGNSFWEDYWGAMYVPLSAIFSLTIFRVLKKQDSLYKH